MPSKRGPAAERFPHREYKGAIDGAARCTRCHAVHQNKRWFYDEDTYTRLSRAGEGALVICPGCRAVATGKADGLLILQSHLLRDMQQNVINLLMNEADREKIKNPLARIVHLEPRQDEIEVLTSTQFLASRLGHAVESAYQGKLEIKKLPQEPFVRVHWKRDQ